MIKLKKLYPLDSLIKAEDFHAMPAVIVQWRFQGPTLSGMTTIEPKIPYIRMPPTLQRLAATCWLRISETHASLDLG